jgi:hypothetical protein
MHWGLDWEKHNSNPKIDSQGLSKVSKAFRMECKWYQGYRAIYTDFLQRDRTKESLYIKVGMYMFTTCSRCPMYAEVQNIGFVPCVKANGGCKSGRIVNVKGICDRRPYTYLRWISRLVFSCHCLHGALLGLTKLLVSSNGKKPWKRCT